MTLEENLLKQILSLFSRKSTSNETTINFKSCQILSDNSDDTAHPNFNH